MSNRICPQCRTNTDDAVCPVDGFPTVEAAKYGRKAKVDPLIGTTFENRYRIERKLGQGGMGAVYKATQLAVDRAVALKVMNKGLGDDLKEVARFQQEARAIASLHHPNVISLIDFGQASTGQLFLVMEFIEGEPLNHLLRRDAPIDAKRAHKMTTQITEALAEAHELGIVHRDMKPENLFVTQLGRRGDFIKVLDFGIAKVRNDQAADIDLTRTGAIIGSPRYMAPEQARGQTITGQTDLYAVGCILYEMLGGKPVFQAASATDYVIAHVTQPPPPLTLEGRELKGPLVDLVMCMLKKKPWDRPQGCEAVLRALEECRDNPITMDEVAPDPVTGPLVDEPGLPSLPGIAPLDFNGTQNAGGGLMVPGGPPADLDTSVARSRSSIPDDVLAQDDGAANEAIDEGGPSKKWLLIAATLVLIAGGSVVAVLMSSGPTGNGGEQKKAVSQSAANNTKSGKTANDSAGKNGAAGNPSTAVASAGELGGEKPPGTDKAGTTKPAVDGDKAVLPEVAASADAGDATPSANTDAGPSHALSADVGSTDSGPSALAAGGTDKPATVVAPVQLVLKAVTLQTQKPGARVFDDGVAIGVTPYEVNWKVSEDPPELVVEAPRGFQDAEVELKASMRGEAIDVGFKKKRRASTKKKKEPVAKKKKKVKWL